MAFTRTASGLCVANLHATNDRPELATADVLLAAEAAVGWAGDSPLLFGGDLNLRPAEDPGIFEELRSGASNSPEPPARARSTTCFLAGSTVVTPPAPWPPEARELRTEGRALRLSDHAPVHANFIAP